MMRCVGVLLLFSYLLLSVAAILEINDTCPLENGRNGICVQIHECPVAVAHVKNKLRPPICKFEGLDTVVCCPLRKFEYILQREPGVVSQQKCKEIYEHLPPLKKEDDTSNAGLSFVRRRKRQTSNATTTEDNVTTTTEDPFYQFELNQPVYISVVGGRDSPALEHPHVAALGYGNESDIQWACGGSLISKNFVLTAGHCINPSLGPVKFVRLGELNLKETVNDTKPQNFKVNRTFLYPEYKPPSSYHDIALIKLDRDIVEDDYVRPACLHVSEQVSQGFWYALGWGATSFGGSSSDRLQIVDLWHFPHKGCYQIYSSSINRRLKRGIDERIQICAGNLKKDTCQGDSGGPLQERNSYERGHQIIGVTSFGKSCGVGLVPGVYTRVSFYVPWIESIVWPE